MTHLAFQSRSKGLTEFDVDYIVIGSGAGGASAAVELARGGAKVAIIEAGPFRQPHDYPHSMMGSLRDLMDDWNSNVTRGRAFWPVVQASVVGGTTVVNSAICVKTPGDVFQLWRDEHGICNEGEDEAIWAYQEEIEKELWVSTTPKESQGHSNRLAEIGAKKLGYHDHDMHRYVKDCLGTGQCLQGCRAGRKQSLNISYVPEVMRSGGVLLSCAPVQKVILKGNQAIGVEGWFRHPLTRKRGARFKVHCKHAVVVSASATHSPLVLWRSGLKTKALGRYFQAHPGTGIFGVYPDRVDLNDGATQGWSTMHFREKDFLKLETLSIPLELIAGRLPGAGATLMKRIEDYPNMAMWCMAVRAETMGRVKPGFGGRPVVHYSFTKRDMERLRLGAYYIAQMHVAAGAKGIVSGIYGMPYCISPDKIDTILEAPLDPRAYTVILSHLFGGCVMGSDPKRSVCDGRGAVHGTKGLYVADASALPTTIGVNPQHTIMAFSKLRAKQLLEAQ